MKSLYNSKLVLLYHENTSREKIFSASADLAMEKKVHYDKKNLQFSSVYSVISINYLSRRAVRHL